MDTVSERIMERIREDYSSLQDECSSLSVLRLYSQRVVDNQYGQGQTGRLWTSTGVDLT